MAEKTITVELRQRTNYQFDIEFSEGMPCPTSAIN